MKLKKLLLFILIFLFFLLLSSNVNAFVVSESGVEKYYLPELPNSSESNNYIMFFNESKLQVILFSFPKTDYLGYDRINNRFTLFNSDKDRRPDEEVTMLDIYYCNVTLNVDKYICGGNWNNYSYVSTSVTLANINYTNLKFIYGNSHIYPCYNDFLVSTLPGICSWKDDIIVAWDSNNGLFCVIPEVTYENYIFVSANSTPKIYSYRSAFNSSVYVNCKFYNFNILSNEWEYLGEKTTTAISSLFPSTTLSDDEFIYFKKDLVFSVNGSIIAKSMGDFFSGFYNYSNFPYIINSAEDLAKGEEDIIIMPGDFLNTEKITFGLQVYEEGADYDSITNVINPIELDLTSNYYCFVDNTGKGYYYKIPWSFLKQYLNKGKQYIYVLAYTYNGKTYTKEIQATYGGLTEEDIFQNSINEQTKVMEEYYKKQEELMQQQQETQQEQLETSKGIWGTLKDLLSFINPFSENFFVYKLIDLLINALKSLFIPSNDFFNNYFNELLNWFSDRLGFLFYPLELILDILDRILSINFQDPIIQIPNFVEPSTNETIIHSQIYNLNSLLENNIFKTCHDVYFILVDAVIVFSLVNLLKHKLEEVFTK